jgi:LEA14-like dessication related protein
MTLPARSTRRRLLCNLLTGALAGLGGTACGSLLPPMNLVAPTIGFSDLSVDSVTRDTVRFTVNIVARNPNAVELPLSNVYFDLTILDQLLAQGKVAEPRFTLPAQGERLLPVAMIVATSDLRAVLLKLALGPATDGTWLLKGTANWGNSPLPLPFEKRGDVRALRRLRELIGG